MWIDEEYIEEELERLKNMIQNNTFSKDKSNNFMSCSDDDITENEIETMRHTFVEKAKEYLKENHHNQYAIWSDWCVHILTVECYRKIMWENQNYKESYIKLKESRDIV